MPKFTTALHTDIGISKKVNQDSMLLMEAETDFGNILFATVCDGMGGLSNGERASAMMVEALSRWFEEEMSKYMEKFRVMMPFAEFEREMKRVCDNTNREIASSSKELSGTTAAILLLTDDAYYLANVGDSRIYKMEEHIEQLTKDQTVVQELIDRGVLEERDALTHPKRSVLLQCIGVGDRVDPQFRQGTYGEDALFILCSDGFRHRVSPDEMEESLGGLYEEEDLREAAVALTELNKERMEKDNISVILIKTESERF